MKKILGLDIGTNSIGWAVVELTEFSKQGNIVDLGSRIIPMDGDAMQKFESGNTVSKNADRRFARMARRLKQRFKLRRTRLIEVLKILGWIPNDFPSDFKSSANNEKQPLFSISNFLPFERSTIVEAKKAFGVENIPEDWIVYYLRKKALTEKISLSELARIIYMMNQRRGFKSSRKDIKADEESDEIRYPLYEKWVQILLVNEINEISEEKGIRLLEIHTEPLTGYIKRKNIPDWIGKEIELEITKKTVKSGDTSYTFSVADPTDWEKKKVALEQNILESGYFVGEYFFHKLVENKNYRIRQQIIDRSLYRSEFEKIWNKQAEFHVALNDKLKLKQIAEKLYKHNTEKQKEITANNLFYLFSNDIIYYQRPLKSQKHSVDFCNYEFKVDNTGKKYGVKVAPKSSPEFQEFRIWQIIHNLRILKLESDSEGKTQIDLDVSQTYLHNDAKARLYDLFDSRALVSHSAIIKELGISPKEYRLNYSADKDFMGNETKSMFRKIFKKHGFTQGDALLNDKQIFYSIWHILYSLESSKEIISALKNPKKNFNIPDEVIQHLSKMPDLPHQYAAYSSKAINKMLPLMRSGKYYSISAIQPSTKERLEKIINAEYDEFISDDIRNRIQQLKLNSLELFEGLPLWIVSYILYGRHSERENSAKYETPDDLDILKLIPNNSLRNPIVEQILKECLSLVKDVWIQHGRPHEIHIELARDLKKTADERKKMDERNRANETDKKRIRSILRELNANPESPMDMERVRLWEETGNDEARNNYIKFSKEPTKSEIEKYKLWGEQNHISPYTGKVIPLSKLFTTDYEIEHIIPRSRYFDDSFANKTICESWVNDYKGHRTAGQLIETDGGRTITHKGNTFTLLKQTDYADHCKNTFKRGKYMTLMREEIPSDFINRQINDTRYITRKLSELLFPVAKGNDNKVSGIVFTIGQISSELKDKWGLNKVWKEILRPRFERLEQITGEKLIEFDTDRNNIHFKKDYKRVDHRHHALDALIIACTTVEHIRYLNTLNSTEEAAKLKYLVKTRYSDFVLPWEGFTKEAKEKLQNVIVSHKNRNRLVSKAVNKYTKWIRAKDGRWIKDIVPQIKGQLLAVRKSMFKEPLGKIILREYNKEVSIKQALELQKKAIASTNKTLLSQVADKELRKKINELIKNSSFDTKEVEKFLKKYPLTDSQGIVITKIQIVEFNEYAAKRVVLDNSFTKDKINKIPNAKNSWLAKLLLSHLEENNNDPNEAFKGESLDVLNKKAGRPVNKVTIFEEIGKKTNFNGKLVEGDKGTNLFFIIYENLKTKERIINESSSLPLLEGIIRLSNKWPLAEEKEGYRSIILSPNDLVYVPEEGEDGDRIDWIKEKNRIHGRIYKMVSCSNYQCFFLPHYISSLLLPYDSKLKKGEFESLNKSEKSLDGQFIKQVCIKIKVDRLGNIIEADNRKINPK